MRYGSGIVTKEDVAAFQAVVVVEIDKVLQAVSAQLANLAFQVEPFRIRTIKILAINILGIYEYFFKVVLNQKTRCKSGF